MPYRKNFNYSFVDMVHGQPSGPSSREMHSVSSAQLNSNSNSSFGDFSMFRTNSSWNSRVVPPARTDHSFRSRRRREALNQSVSNGIGFQEERVHVSDAGADHRRTEVNRASTNFRVFPPSIRQHGGMDHSTRQYGLVSARTGHSFGSGRRSEAHNQSVPNGIGIQERRAQVTADSRRTETESGLTNFNVFPSSVHRGNGNNFRGRNSSNGMNRQTYGNVSLNHSLMERSFTGMDLVRYAENNQLNKSYAFYDAAAQRQGYARLQPEYNGKPRGENGTGRGGGHSNIFNDARRQRFSNQPRDNAYSTSNSSFQASSSTFYAPKIASKGTQRENQSNKRTSNRGGRGGCHSTVFTDSYQQVSKQFGDNVYEAGSSSQAPSSSSNPPQQAKRQEISVTNRIQDESIVGQKEKIPYVPFESEQRGKSRTQLSRNSKAQQAQQLNQSRGGLINNSFHNLDGSILDGPTCSSTLSQNNSFLAQKQAWGLKDQNISKNSFAIPKMVHAEATQHIAQIEAERRFRGILKNGPSNDTTSDPKTTRSESFITLGMFSTPKERSKTFDFHQNRSLGWKNTTRLSNMVAVDDGRVLEQVGWYLALRASTNPMPDIVVYNGMCYFCFPDTDELMDMPPRFLFKFFPAQVYEKPGQVFVGRYKNIPNSNENVLAQIIRNGSIPNKTSPESYTQSNFPDHLRSRLDLSDEPHCYHKSWIQNKLAVNPVTSNPVEEKLSKYGHCWQSFDPQTENVFDSNSMSNGQEGTSDQRSRIVEDVIAHSAINSLSTIENKKKEIVKRSRLLPKQAKAVPPEFAHLKPSAVAVAETKTSKSSNSNYEATLENLQRQRQKLWEEIRNQDLEPMNFDFQPEYERRSQFPISLSHYQESASKAPSSSEPSTSQTHSILKPSSSNVVQNTPEVKQLVQELEKRLLEDFLQSEDPLADDKIESFFVQFENKKVKLERILQMYKCLQNDARLKAEDAVSLWSTDRLTYEEHQNRIARFDAGIAKAIVSQTADEIQSFKQNGFLIQDVSEEKAWEQRALKLQWLTKEFQNDPNEFSYYVFSLGDVAERKESSALNYQFFSKSLESLEEYREGGQKIEKLFAKFKLSMDVDQAIRTAGLSHKDIYEEFNNAIKPGYLLPKGRLYRQFILNILHMFRFSIQSHPKMYTLEKDWHPELPFEGIPFDKDGKPFDFEKPAPSSAPSVSFRSV